MKPKARAEALGYSACILLATGLAVGTGSLGQGAGLGLLLAAGSLWLAGLDVWRREPSPSGARAGWAVWITALAVGAGLRGAGALAPLELSDDIHRYVWEADLVRQGQSPYAYAPNAPEREAQRQRLPGVFERMNHTDISAAYPMGMQLATAAALTGWDPTGVDAGERAVARLRWFFGLCDAAGWWLGGPWYGRLVPWPRSSPPAAGTSTPWAFSAWWGRWPACPTGRMRGAAATVDFGCRWR